MTDVRVEPVARAINRVDCFSDSQAEDEWEAQRDLRIEMAEAALVAADAVDPVRASYAAGGVSIYAPAYQRRRCATLHSDTRRSI